MDSKDLEFSIAQYGRDLYSFCCYLTRNIDEANDLYQDTFLKFYELDYENIKEGKNLLMQIAFNLFRNQKKKIAIRQRIEGAPVSVEELEALNAENDVEFEAMNQVQNKMVRQAVLSLPEKYRIPILLFYMENLKILEISKILSLPTSTVKTRLSRGKEILRKELHNER